MENTINKASKKNEILVGKQGLWEGLHGTMLKFRTE